MTSPIPQGTAAIEISCPEFGTVAGRREVCALLLTPEIVAMMERQNLDPSDVNSMKWPIFGLSRHATCKLLMNRRSLIDLVARDPQVIAPNGGQNTTVEWNADASYRIWFICGSKADSSTTRFDRMRLAEIQPLVSVEMGDPVIGDALYIVTFKCDRWAWRSFRTMDIWRRTVTAINWPDFYPQVSTNFLASFPQSQIASITPDLIACNESLDIEAVLDSIRYDFFDGLPGNEGDEFECKFIQSGDTVSITNSANEGALKYFDWRSRSAPLMAEIDRVLGCMGSPIYYIPLETQDSTPDRGIFQIGMINDALRYVGFTANYIRTFEEKYRSRLIAGTVGKFGRSNWDAENAGQTAAQDGSYPFYVDFSELRYNEAPFFDIVSMPIAVSPDGYIGDIWENAWRWTERSTDVFSNVTEIPAQPAGTELTRRIWTTINPFSDQTFLCFMVPTLGQSETNPRDASTFGPFANMYITPDFATHVSAMDLQTQGTFGPFTSPLSPNYSDPAWRTIPADAYPFGFFDTNWRYTGACATARFNSDSELWFSGWFFPNKSPNADDDFPIMGCFSWLELRLQTDGKGFPHPVTKLWGKKLDPIMRPVPDDGQTEITCSGLAKTWKTMDGKTRIHVEYPFGMPMLLKIIDSELIAPNQWKYTCEHALKSDLSTQIAGSQATFGINTFSPEIEDFYNNPLLPNMSPLAAQRYYAYNLAERGNGAGFAGPGYKLPLSQTGFNVLPIGKDRDGVQHEVYVQAMVYLAGAGRQETNHSPKTETPCEAMAYFCMPNAIDGECDTPLVSESDYDGGTFGT